MSMSISSPSPGILILIPDTLLPCDVEQSEEHTVPANPRPRMVAWPGSGQRRLRLAWAWPATTPSPGVLPTMAVRGRWTLYRGSSKVEVFFLAVD
jgi:hypothetical protein